MKTVIFSAVALAMASPALAQSGAAVPASDPAAASQPSDPATILKTEFPSYDKDANGNLSKDEFSTWLIALKKAAPQQTPLTDAQRNEWLGKAFVDADADKNTSVSLAELTTYLTRG